MIVALLLFHAGLLAIYLANIVYLRRHVCRPSDASPRRLSVIIPARNEAENLGRLLPTILEQDHNNIEVIIYDDGSEDDTWAVIQSFDDPCLIAVRGSGPPPGWVGKVHALYQATRKANGDLYLFLDADAELLSTSALRHLAACYQHLRPDSVLTGLTLLRGGGKLLVSLVPFTILTSLPWPLVRPLRFRSLGALNGQCWMLDAERYHLLEPHLQVKDEVLEDVNIGRYLKGKGITPVLVDVQPHVAIHMYRDLGDAWLGFRKNAYLLAGGNPVSFIILWLIYLLGMTLAFIFSPWFLLTLLLLKLVSDQRAGFPLWVSLLTPVSFALGSLLQMDSAISHWTGRVAWKGRRVGSVSDDA